MTQILLMLNTQKKGKKYRKLLVEVAKEDFWQHMVSLKKGKFDSLAGCL